MADLTATPEDAAWDLADVNNPQPNIWPACTTCGEPYVYRRGLSMSKGFMWAWMRDCKHKAGAELHNADGRYTPAAD
jgi:hypothetical protein